MNNNPTIPKKQTLLFLLKPIFTKDVKKINISHQNHLLSEITSQNDLRGKTNTYIRIIKNNNLDKSASMNHIEQMCALE